MRAFALCTVMLGCSGADGQAVVRVTRGADVDVTSEHERVVRESARVGAERPALLARMRQRARRLDVRAGQLRERGEDPALWSAYDRARAWLALDVESLPFNTERAYRDHAADVLREVMELEIALDQIEARLTEQRQREQRRARALSTGDSAR